MSRKFDFDRNKNEINKSKHGMSLLNATSCFNDPNAVTKKDKRHDYGEDRFVTVGIGYGFIGKLISLVWTPRGDKTRLISGRQANRSEKRWYSQENGGTNG